MVGKIFSKLKCSEEKMLTLMLAYGESVSKTSMRERLKLTKLREMTKEHTEHNILAITEKVMVMLKCWHMKYADRKELKC